MPRSRNPIDQQAACRTPDALPPPDRELSPVTGWTRSHWESLADRILARAQSDASPGHGRIVPPTGLAGRAATSDVDQLEGFARTFLLAALRLAQPGADPRAERHRQATADWWARGLINGTDPCHPDAWPAIEDHDQTMVEAAAVAVALHWSRDTVWARLDDPARSRVVDWLATSRGRTCAENNHVLFLATVQAFLAGVGAEHDRDHTEAALATIEHWYAGDGWYTDGYGRRFDHYNAFTFHLYPWLIDELLGTCGARPQRWRERLHQFLTGYRSLLANGTPVLQGRSLAYRWAVLGPFWLGAALDATPLSAGETRLLASRVVAGFVGQGVAADGRLGLGWRGADCESMLQSYTMAGSPHWASKGMLGLLLPGEHPVWSDPEPADPAEPGVASLAGPGWLVDPARRVTRLLNHGSDGHPRHDDRWYRRLAYSDVTVPAEVDGVRDSSVIPVQEGSCWSDRGLRGGLTGADWACSHRVGNLGDQEVHLDLVSVVRDGAELRVARLSGAEGCRVRMSGYALPSDGALTQIRQDGVAAVSCRDGIRSAIRAVPVAGSALEVPGATVCAEQDTPLGTFVAIPYLDVAASGQTGIVAAVVTLDRSGPGGDAALPVVSATAEGVVVIWGGSVRTVPWPPTGRWPGDSIGQGIWTPWPAHTQESR